MANRSRNAASRHLIRALESKALSQRTMPERMADALVVRFGTSGFFFACLIVTAVWMVVNLGLIPGITPFDPYPFILLTMVASVGAIFMTVIILVSQNRHASIDTIRSELLLQMIVIAERELTKTLHLIAASRGSRRKTSDKELADMLRDTDVSAIERELTKQLENRK